MFEGAEIRAELRSDGQARWRWVAEVKRDNVGWVWVAEFSNLFVASEVEAALRVLAGTVSITVSD